MGHQTFARRLSLNLTPDVFKMLWPRPLAPRSSAVPLISILTLPFCFMWGLLTCFTRPVYRHLLPPLSLVDASTQSLFLCCCCCFGLYFTHPSVSLVLVPLFFMFELFFQGFLVRELNTVQLSTILNSKKNSNFLKQLLLLPSCFMTLLVTLPPFFSEKVVITINIRLKKIIKIKEIIE